MRKWTPLLAVCLGTFMLLIDITIVNVALPDITRDLGASFSQVQWVIDIYALSLAALLLGAGGLADAVGRRRVYLAGGPALLFSRVKGSRFPMASNLFGTMKRAELQRQQSNP